MAFIHKNVNSALLMLISFLSVALVTATVYSVNAFDNINSAYADQAMRADSLAKELADKSAMTTSLQATAELTQAREAALAKIVEQQKQDAVQAQADTATVNLASTATSASTASTATKARANTQVYNPYRNRYAYWPYATKLVI
jgi:hypothetical protein